jgi:hypothetical protein
MERNARTTPRQSDRTAVKAARTERYNRPFCLLLVDIDNFKDLLTNDPDFLDLSEFPLVDVSVEPLERRL